MRAKHLAIGVAAVFALFGVGLGAVVIDAKSKERGTKPDGRVVIDPETGLEIAEVDLLAQRERERREKEAEETRVRTESQKSEPKRVFAPWGVTSLAEKAGLSPTLFSARVLGSVDLPALGDIAYSIRFADPQGEARDVTVRGDRVYRASPAALSRPMPKPVVAPERVLTLLYEGGMTRVRSLELAYFEEISLTSPGSSRGVSQLVPVKLSKSRALWSALCSSGDGRLITRYFDAETGAPFAPR